METDVIIIGGGPAGSTCASLLAAAGHRVLVLEKSAFPRFHIGESLLPCGLPILDRLQVSLDDGAFLRKAGAEFIDERRERREVFLFRDGLPGTLAYAYQVERARFDHLLLERSRAAGADVHEGETVIDLALEADRVEVTTARGTYRGRYLIDATGQDAYLGRRHRSIQKIAGFGSAAVFCHFDGIRESTAEQLAGLGNIQVLMLDDGWAWLIPLWGRRLSVGVVTRRGHVTKALLDDTIAASPHIRELTRGAERTPARLFRNFSYRNVLPYGVRWATVGDACLFLDPVFSSGVGLAMLAGQRTADVLAAALATVRESEPELLAPVLEDMRRVYVSFASLIGAFYNTRIVEHVFFAPEPDRELRAGLISLLAGDVWRNDNRFQDMLISSERRRIDLFAPAAVTADRGSTS